MAITDKNNNSHSGNHAPVGSEIAIYDSTDYIVDDTNLTVNGWDKSQTYSRGGITDKAQ